MFVVAWLPPSALRRGRDPDPPPFKGEGRNCLPTPGPWRDRRGGCREPWPPSLGEAVLRAHGCPSQAAGAAPSEPAGKGVQRAPARLGIRPHGVRHQPHPGSLSPLWEQLPCTCAGWGAGHSSLLGEGSGLPGAWWGGTWTSREPGCGRGLGSAQTTQPRLGSREVLKLQGTQSRSWAWSPGRHTVPNSAPPPHTHLDCGPQPPHTPACERFLPQPGRGEGHEAKSQLFPDVTTPLPFLEE